MKSFIQLLRRNRNYRMSWAGQVVSEMGDHFNNIAVFSMVLAHTRSGLAVSGVMLARALPAILAGPIAGVALDRFDRRRLLWATCAIKVVLVLLFMPLLAGVASPDFKERWPWLLAIIFL